MDSERIKRLIIRQYMKIKNILIIKNSFIISDDKLTQLTKIEKKKIKKQLFRVVHPIRFQTVKKIIKYEINKCTLFFQKKYLKKNGNKDTLDDFAQMILLGMDCVG